MKPVALKVAAYPLGLGNGCMSRSFVCALSSSAASRPVDSCASAGEASRHAPKKTMRIATPFDSNTDWLLMLRSTLRAGRFDRFSVRDPRALAEPDEHAGYARRHGGQGLLRLTPNG